MQIRKRLTDKELDSVFERFNIPLAGREHVQDAREGPSRLVQSGLNNLNTFYPSNKNGHTYSAECRSGEYFLGIECEFSKTVNEFHNQPPKISVLRTFKNGKKRRQWITADTLIISQENGIEVVETKPRKRLDNLTKHYPTDWQKTDDGYVFKPAQEAYAELGISYRVVCDDEFNQFRIANLRNILQSRRVENQITPEILGSVQNVLSDHSWIRLSELREKAALKDYTPIFQMIDQELIFASLSEELLTQPDSTFVSGSIQLLAQYRGLRADTQPPFTELDDTQIVSLDVVPSEKAAKKALEALEKVNSGESSRQVRRYKKLIADGEKRGLNAFQSLLPKTSQSGNRLPRINEKCVEFIHEFIEHHYATPNRIPIGKAYSLYKNLAKKALPTYPPVARSTFAQYLKNYDPVNIARGRGGRRAANAARPPSSVENRELRATAPFELGVIDQCLAKINCVLATSNGITWVERPWITALRDVYSGAILAVWVSFQKPSRRTDAIVLRRCVRRWGRLPAAILSDRGSSFTSVFWLSFLAHCEVEVILRDAENSRGGSDIERVFGRFIFDWLVLRPGNLVDYKNVRSYSGTHKPDKFAVLDLSQFMAELLAYIEWFNETIIGTKAACPNEILNQGLELFPFIGPQISETREFTVASAIDVANYTVDPVRGIHIDDKHYWHAALSELPPRRKPEVRRDPENPFRVYACVGDNWVPCSSTEAKIFKTLDPVYRMSEAVRIMDCRSLRTAAKDEAEQQLISQHLALESPVTAEPVSLPGNATAATNPAQDVSIFAQLKSIELQPSQTTKWEKSE